LRVDDSRNPFVELRRILNAVRCGDLRSEATRKMTANDFKGALESAMKARDKSPEIDSNYVTLAEVYLRMDQKPEALNAVRKAVELNPSNKNQLPLNKAFEPLTKDPEFLKIVAK